MTAKLSPEDCASLHIALAVAWNSLTSPMPTKPMLLLVLSMSSCYDGQVVSSFCLHCEVHVLPLARAFLETMLTQHVDNHTAPVGSAIWWHHAQNSCAIIKCQQGSKAPQSKDLPMAASFFFGTKTVIDQLLDKVFARWLQFSQPAWLRHIFNMGYHGTNLR